mgnify:CR=1 FL=1
MKKIGVLGLMAALAVTGAVAFLPKGVLGWCAFDKRGCYKWPGSGNVRYR